MGALRVRDLGPLANTLSLLLAGACTPVPDLPVGMMSMPANTLPVAGATSTLAMNAIPAPATGASSGTAASASASPPPTPMPPPAGGGTANAPAAVGGSGGSAGAGRTALAGTGGTATAGRTGSGGASGAAGSAGMLAAGSGGSTALQPIAGPTLPAIRGACPEFRDGSTLMVAGHGGVVIAAGAPGKAGSLLFYWHGTGSSAAEAMRTIPAEVRSEILAAGGIIAAFNGSQSSMAGADCSGTGAHNPADFDAADQIAACAVKNHGIDSRRIYTSGCSAGGLQAGCMALMRSSYIAAAAPNSGGLYQRMPPIEWQDTHSPAIFTVHGGSTDMVIVTFSQTSAELDKRAKEHGSFVVNCDHGGGHCQQPAVLQTAGWQFMKDHPWGYEKSPWAATIPAGAAQYCKVY